MISCVWVMWVQGFRWSPGKSCARSRSWKRPSHPVRERERERRKKQVAEWEGGLAMRKEWKEREKCNMDLMGEHRERTVAGRWREWVWGGGVSEHWKEEMRGEERNGGITLHLSLTFVHKDSHAAPLPCNPLLNLPHPAEKTDLYDL